MGKFSVLLVALFASSSALAGIESIEVTGTGKTLPLAIDAALVSAVEQVSGVTVSSQRQSLDSSLRKSGEGTSFLRQRTGEMSFGTAGRATYRILSENCGGEECKVRLLANIETNDDLERQKKLKGMNKNRRTIAVEPFVGAHSKEFSRAIEARLVQDRKFRVISDRKQPGVDYVLKGRVVEAGTTKRVVDNSRTVELTGEHIDDVQVFYDSKVVVEYQLIDLVNNQIKWSAKVPTTSGRNNLSYLLELSSRKVFEQLKENIYPMLLIAAEDGSLVLNSGGSTVELGERFEVFAAGEKIIDPITKESLGFTESKIGIIKVIKVLPKMAYVELVEGSRDALYELPIVRKMAKSKASVKAKPKAVEAPVVKKSSGIIL